MKEDHRYDDIIHLAYPRPGSRRKMTMLDRAAQFSPFAALTGYEAAIAETGRLTDSPVELDVDGTAMLDEKIRALCACADPRPYVRINYFLPDQRKSGGAYVTAAGCVRKIDRYQREILMEDGTVIGFEQIYDIDF